MPNDGEPPQRQTLRRRIARLIAGGPDPEMVHPPGAPSAASPLTIRLRLKEFETASVRDVMTSRVDIDAVEADATLGEVLGFFANKARSRMPVYRDSLDEPLGFIHIKDVVAEGVRGGWTPDTLASRPVERLLREIMFVPESTRLPDLLVRMQATRIHIALVIDEYGGTGGMVCLEDLVEQIVGDIEDEHDEAGPRITRRGRFSWDLDGLATVEEVERQTGMALRIAEFEADVDTMGGLVSAMTGRVPLPGERLEHPLGPVIEIIEADPRRVLRLRLKVPKPAPSPLADEKSPALDP